MNTMRFLSIIPVNTITRFVHVPTPNHVHHITRINYTHQRWDGNILYCIRKGKNNIRNKCQINYLIKCGIKKKFDILMKI